MEDKQILISRVDGGYIVNTSYPHRTQNLVRQTLDGVMDILVDCFAEPFNAEQPNIITAIEDFFEEGKGK